MSYIINNTNPFISVKLTEVGRQQLSLGQLNFSYWAIGDSEINYGREAIVDANSTDVTLSGVSKIMRPFDRQPNFKSFITQSNASSFYQTLTTGDLSVVKAVVNNEAAERGFFDNVTTGFTTSLSSSLTPNYQTISNTNLTGGTSLTLTGTTNLAVGDYLLLKLTNNTVGTQTTSETTKALPNLWFKIQSIVGNSITVDRNLPAYSASSASSITIFYKGGEIYDTISSGNTTAYWDTGTLSFNSNINVTCSDVPVWNMNNVWCENMAGMSANTAYEDYTKFGSYQYLGTKYPFLGYSCESTGVTSTFNCNGPGISYPDDVSKSISIIHYTNNAISNLYGEFLYVDATNSKIIKVDLPNLMYHRRNYATGSGTTMGMRFIASGSTQLIEDTNIEYIDLIEDPDYIASASTPNIVGKVFTQLKMIVFENDEIVGAMSYKSNRNWTLPALAANLQAPSGGTSTGILETNETMYLTYSLENTGTSGLTSSLPCQDYIKITNSTSSAKDVVFRISETDLLPYMRKLESVGYDGYGFYAKKFKLLYQIVSDSTTRPDSSSWKLYDYTTTAITTTTGETINPSLLENQSPIATGFVLDKLKHSAATSFDLVSLLNMAPNNQPTYLQFGDERFFYGNLRTFIGGTIYKTVFDLKVNASQFNFTTNPTRDPDPNTNPPDIRISEVGIFDSAQNLVCIGKFSKPINLSIGNTITLELSLDF